MKKLFKMLGYEPIRKEVKTKKIQVVQQVRPAEFKHNRETLETLAEKVMDDVYKHHESFIVTNDQGGKCIMYSYEVVVK